MAGQRTSAGHPAIRRSFVASDAATRAALLAVTEALIAAGLPEDVVGSAELILAETLNNIVEHAYAGKEGPVELIIAVGSAGLDCTVRDQGPAAPVGFPPDPPLPEVNPPHDLPEGGFGWHIIRALTADLSYKREAGWNVLRFRIPVCGGD